MSKANSKYEMIKNRIEEQIQSGIYQENDKIPSESELCKMFDSSRITVRKALDELVTMGVLYRQQGIGTFVKPVEKPEKREETKKILLVLPNYPELFSSGIISAMLLSIEKALQATEYSLVTMMEPRNEEDNHNFMVNIRAMAPEGIIYGFYFNKNLMDDLKKLGIPLVFLDSEPNDNVFDVVTGEDFESAYRVTNLLIMDGNRRIGFYSPWNEDFSTCLLRCQGVKCALEDSRIPWKEKWFQLRDVNPEFHEAVTKFDMVTDIKKYLQENPELEALVVMNDTVAFAAFKAASELKIEIPGQLKLVSYGNYNWSSFPLINLTTYEQHFSRYGKEAIRLLLKRMKGELPAMQQRRIIKYDLQRRGSF